MSRDTLDRPAVDAGHAAALAADFARQHHIIGIIHQLFALEDGMHRFLFRTAEVEHTFDERGICIGADDGRVRPPADQHDHSIQDDGFARAGLTRQDDQARAEVAGRVCR